MGNLGMVEARTGVEGGVSQDGLPMAPGTELCPFFLLWGFGQFYTLLFPKPDSYLLVSGFDISTSHGMTRLRLCDIRTALNPDLGEPRLLASHARRSGGPVLPCQRAAPLSSSPPQILRQATRKGRFWTFPLEFFSLSLVPPPSFMEMQLSYNTVYT